MLERDRSLSYSDGEVSVGCGAEQVVSSTRSLRRRGRRTRRSSRRRTERVTRRWCVCAAPARRLSPARRVPASGGRRKPDAVEAAVSERTRRVVLNAPGNPSGVVSSHDELTALADVLRRRPQVMILSDEACAHGRHLDTHEPDGASRLSPRLVPGNDLALADTLVEAGCPTVPGNAFGAAGHLRISLATNDEAHAAGCQTIIAVPGETS
ncbi:aminotransferase class I/II-fold pyridoxal phosphate-dependent enzyme [Streptomyces gelaticus]|uniref:aminotransferase class I/II-fold pyridoxal phosphate-dependent enzyme n=1 Tax=Streptomyces gelaticus TaxID=285446 RepID=UPI0037B8757C